MGGAEGTQGHPVFKLHPAIPQDGIQNYLSRPLRQETCFKCFLLSVLGSTHSAPPEFSKGRKNFQTEAQR